MVMKTAAASDVLPARNHAAPVGAVIIKNILSITNKYTHSRTQNTTLIIPKPAIGHEPDPVPPTFHPHNLSP
jgi:hypothetical protein